MSNQLTAQKPKFSVAITTPAYQELIRNTLSDPKTVKRFIASITSAVAVNSALQECDSGSILAGALLGESLGLSPSPQLGQYYLVPFKTKDKTTGEYIKKAQFILGYKGYIQLALRSGYYKDLDVMEIRQGEYKGKDKITAKPQFEFLEDDEAREKLPIVGYMAYFEYLNGFRKIEYWSKEKMEAHADKYSQAYSSLAAKDYHAGKVPKADEWKFSSYWYQDFDGMAKKTLLRQLISKWGIMSTEMQTAIESDISTVEVDGTSNLIVENAPDDPISTVTVTGVIEPEPEPKSKSKKTAKEEEMEVNLDDLFGTQ